jgi:hypothetical protein
MKSRIAIALFLGLAAASPAAAQPDIPDDLQTVDVHGTVIDAGTGKPVAGATVTLDGTDRTRTADKSGRFVFTGVPVGATLIVVGPKHEAAILIVESEDAGEIALLPEGSSSEVIEVESEAPPAAVGATTLGRDDVQRLPGTGNDLVASLKVLPGVGATSFPVGYSGVVIRGSSPQDSKVMLDGFEVPVIYHDIAFRSIIPTDAIESFEYLPGGFDVAFGRASSGLVKVTTRRGERRGGGQAEVSVIDGGVLGHGPVGDKGSFFLGVRRSTVDFILPAIIPDDVDLGFTTVPRYYDTQARVDYDLGEYQLAVTMLGTDDVLSGFADDDEDPDQHFYTYSRFARLIGSLKWHRDKWAAEVAVSPIASAFRFDFGTRMFIKVKQLGTTLRGEVSHTSEKADGLRDVVARAGGEVQVTRNRIELALPKAPDEGVPMMSNGPPSEEQIVEHEDATYWIPDVAGWASIGAAFDERVRGMAGVRVDGFLRNNAVAVQPRGELSARVATLTTLRLSAGAYRRPAEFQDELQQPDLEPERSTQLVFGVEQNTRVGVKAQASAYYTDRSALLTRDMTGEYVNQGRGATYGGELLVTAKRGRWFGWLSYSLSRSTRIDAPGADERLFDYDQPHVLNALGSYKVGKWQFGARFTFASGTPYTPVLGSIYMSDGDYYVPIYGDINSERVVPHHQVDIRIDRSWKIGSASLSAFLDVQNVYLNQSTVGYGYNFDYSERYAFTALPIIPSLGLRGEL